jgi:hypothetical protein
MRKHVTWRSLVVHPSLVALCVGMMACGGGGDSAPAAGRGTVASYSHDADDSLSHRSSLERNDDNEVLYYGRAANARETRTATAFVKRYFAAAVAADGARVCSMFLPQLVKGITLDRNEPAYMRGKNCTEIMTKLFEHRHRLYVTEAAGLKIAGVRVTASTAFVLLSFNGIRERRYMGVERAGGTWKLEALTDSEYP